MTHHLHLDSDIRDEDLCGLARNWYPEATREERTIRVSDSAALVFNELDEAWELQVEPHREQSDSASQIPDSYGLTSAFPDGLPVGEERDLLEFALSAARRLGGTVATDTGHELRPHVLMMPNLTIISPYEMNSAQALEVVREIVPEATLAVAGGDSSLQPGESSESPDGPQSTPFALALPVFPEADLEVRVERLEHEIPALAHVQWVREGAVSYAVMFQPHDESRAVSTTPDQAQITQWREAYLGCSAIAKSLHDAVGGFIVDIDDFLVEPEALF